MAAYLFAKWHQTVFNRKREQWKLEEMKKASAGKQSAYVAGEKSA